MKLPVWFHRFGSPPWLYGFAGLLMPWLAVACGGLLAWGMVHGLFIAPPDYQQGDSYRIMFVHVPSAWMSLFIFVVMAVSGLVGLVWRMKVAEAVVVASAPIGAMFTAVTLITGSLWGKPMWGVWWAWDARLTSELILLFLYLGIIGLAQLGEDARAGARAASLMAVVGVVMVPIIHFSVKWWNTLHQGDTVRIFGESQIHPSMLTPLLVMAVATKLFYAFNVLQRLRVILLQWEGGKQWAQAEAMR